MVKACLSNDLSNSKDKILTISDDEQALSTYQINENGRRVLCNTRTSCRIRQNLPMLAQKPFDVAAIMATDEYKVIHKAFENMSDMETALVAAKLVSLQMRVFKTLLKKL